MQCKLDKKANELTPTGKLRVYDATRSGPNPGSKSKGAVIWTALTNIDLLYYTCSFVLILVMTAPPEAFVL
jgi:hypothetical protein